MSESKATRVCRGMWKYSLLPLSLATIFACIPIVRNTHVPLNYGVIRAFRIPLWSFIGLWTWNHRSKAVPLSRTKVTILYFIITPPVMATEFVLGFYSINGATLLEDQTYNYRYYVLVDMLLLLSLFYLVVPCAYFFNEKWAPYAVTKAGIGSVAAVLAFAFAGLYSLGLSAIGNWTNFDPMRYSAVPFSSWGAALIIDRHRPKGKGDMGYVMFVVWICFGLAHGARGFFVTLYGIGLNFGGFSQLFLMLTVAMTFACLRLLWQFTLRMAYSSINAMSMYYSIMLFEDLFVGFAFLGMDASDPIFYLLLLFQTAKQIARDTFFWEDLVSALLRWYFGDGVLAPSPDTVMVFERRWRILEQNLLSEFIASVVIPVALLYDLGLSHGNQSVTRGMTAREVYEQCLLYLILLVVELATHVLVRRIFNARLQRAHVNAKHGSDVDADSMTATMPAPVLHHAWGTSDSAEEKSDGGDADEGKVEKASTKARDLSPALSIHSYVSGNGSGHHPHPHHHHGGGGGGGASTSFDSINSPGGMRVASPTLSVAADASEETVEQASMRAKQASGEESSNDLTARSPRSANPLLSPDTASARSPRGGRTVAGVRKSSNGYRRHSGSGGDPNSERSSRRTSRAEELEKKLHIAGAVAGVWTPAFEEEGRSTKAVLSPRPDGDPGWEEYDVLTYYRNSGKYWRDNAPYFIVSTLLVVFDSLVALSSIQEILQDLYG